MGITHANIMPTEQSNAFIERSKAMTNISVYDTEARQIEQICDEYGTTEAELIEAMLNAIEAGEIKISEWL